MDVSAGCFDKTFIHISHMYCLMMNSKQEGNNFKSDCDYRALAYVKTLLAYACFIIRFKYMLVSSFLHSNEGLTLKMSAFLPFMVASLHFQLSC